MFHVKHAIPPQNCHRRVCGYEGSDYEAFWKGRGYEDAAERVAIRRLLPPRGDTLVEIGAGYGRLADLYQGYRRVVLVDSALSQLLLARRRLGGDRRYAFVVGNLYHLPLASSSFDVAVTVRTLHHVEDLPAALREIRRLLRPRATYILEYANKRNLKEILRYILGHSQKRPFSPDPVEYLDLHFNFHPAYIASCLEGTGFAMERELAVSQFRLPLLKRLFPTRLLVFLDSLLQAPTAPLRLAPSIFLATRAQEEGDH